ncbi:unnamed protein product [Sphenostylis stenocarpa]|uniref:Pentatricopeptide repeat-containing protein n=1 Tax=Sphenostylis stenocarpa TaxID=92480 RepID=A0AA86RVH0_9FABA|nr:unnamed protein product [Sphenostylis stenocarpa]
MACKKRSGGSNILKGVDEIVDVLSYALDLGIKVVDTLNSTFGLVQCCFMECLLSCYVQSELRGEAVNLFKEMVRSLGRMLYGLMLEMGLDLDYYCRFCVLRDRNELTLMLLDDMKISGNSPNMLYITVKCFKGLCCNVLKELDRQLHSSLIKMDAESYLVASVGLIDMYSKCEMMGDAISAYDKEGRYCMYCFKLWLLAVWR